jgi:hypothetical protein
MPILVISVWVSNYFKIKRNKLYDTIHLIFRREVMQYVILKEVKNAL